MRPSITNSVPLISLVTKARQPSGAQTAALGRMSTSRFATTESRRGSITETELLVSAVTYIHVPFGLTATPSGSMPTTRVAIVLPARMSNATAMPASSFAAYAR